MNFAETLIKGIYLPALISNLLRTKITPLKETTELLDTYDYIIVGSGPGGSIVANRLSEDPAIKVLLLEAGKQDNLTTHIPLVAGALLGDGYDWFYDTTPQKEVCLEKKDQKCPLSSGKVIGGSSSINFMYHARGNKMDYDEWSQEGNTGWSDDEVLPYFKKHENFISDQKCTENQYHGCNGELTITETAAETERTITDTLMSSMKDLGYSIIDSNERNQIGVTRGHYTIRNGSRLSAASAFLRPVQNRTNLYIVTEAFVHKILIDPEKKTAIGVLVQKEGEIKEIKATKEVILSAGPYSSPKILLLSGIGPKEELEKLKIPVIVDLPGVGRNLQDPLSIPIYATTGKSLSNDDVSLIAPKSLKQWMTKREGFLASPSGVEALVFAKTKYETEDRPDMLMVFNTQPIYEMIRYYIQRALKIDDEMWNNYIAKLTNQEIFSLAPFLLRPASKGTITLKSSDPHDDPLIDPNYLSEENDRNRMLEGIRLVHKIMNASQFLEKGYKLSSVVLDNCKEHEFNSDEYLLCTLRYLAYGVYDGCCTNKMGPDTDKMAVVDHRLRVKGITRLRVVDASVFPNQVSTSPAATVYMIGEKAAAMIKEDN